MNKLTRTSSIRFVMASLLGAMALSGCGNNTTYDPVQSQLNSDSPGSMTVPSKVDIVLAVDDSGSTAQIRGALNASLMSFMNTLQAQSWDYRITAIPLTRVESLNQITTSRHDPNWGSQWTAPYPGAPQTGGVPSAFFRLPEAFSIPSWSPTSGEENGLRNIGNFLRTPSMQNSFIRKEALLATIAFSNGNDTSDGINYDAQPYRPVATVSASVLNGIKNAKGTALASTVKLYAAVNTLSDNRTCLGSSSYRGTRYMSAAGQLGGQSYDLCGGNFSQILSSMTTHLQGQQLNFTTTHLFLDREPNLASVQIVKHSNGSNIEVPSNGWTYLGYKTNFPAITQPVAMNYKTGYVIQLLGNYQLTGSDTATVTFTPAGIQSSP